MFALMNGYHGSALSIVCPWRSAAPAATFGGGQILTYRLQLFLGALYLHVSSLKNDLRADLLQIAW
jgi:hypothetical protein